MFNQKSEIMRKLSNYLPILLLLATLASESCFGQKVILYVYREDPISNFASDVDLKDSLKTWGYEVDSMSNADFASLAPTWSLYDGCFIHETANSSDIVPFATRDEYPVPLVSTEGYGPRADRWGWLDDNTTEFYNNTTGSEDEQHIIIKDNSHYITQIFNIGDDVKWSDYSGTRQDEWQVGAIKEAKVDYAAKLAVNKATQNQTGFWNLVTVEPPELDNKVAFWSISEVGLNDFDRGQEHWGTPEFFTIIHRMCDWAYDNMPSSVQNLRSESFALAAFPNPATDQLTIRFTAQRPGTAVATLYSMTGQRIAVFNRNAVSGRNAIELYASDYAPGVYHIGVEMDGRTEYLKVVIR